MYILQILDGDVWCNIGIYDAARGLDLVMKLEYLAGFPTRIVPL